jgi:PhnB protein
MPAPPIPPGFEGAIPALCFKDAKKAIAWYEQALGAKETLRLLSPDGSIAHAEIKIGSAVIMLGDEMPPFNKSPETLGGTSVVLALYVEDVDALFNRAVAAGAKVVFPVADQFYGDRSGRFEDPFGYMWILSTHQLDMTQDEMQKRFEDWLAKQQAG